MNISNTGLLTVGDVDEDINVVITAIYTVNEANFIDTHNVTIRDGGVATEVIVDNLDGDAGGTGTWLTSGGANPFAANSVYSKTSGDQFEFGADLASGTQYAVYMWWTNWPSRRSNLPVQIFSGNTLLDAVSINQLTGGGQWNLLGFYTFSDRATVLITAVDGSSTNADAVKFMPVSQLSEIIVDNGSPGTSLTGTWSVSGGADPYGSNSLWSRTVGDTYSFEVDATGTFDIEMRWTAWSSRSNGVTVEIYDGVALLDTVSVDQTANASQWMQLGTGSFTFSTMPKVKIIATGNDTSTNADAVKFVPQ